MVFFIFILAGVLIFLWGRNSAKIQNKPKESSSKKLSPADIKWGKDCPNVTHCPFKRATLSV